MYCRTLCTEAGRTRTILRPSVLPSNDDLAHLQSVRHTKTIFMGNTKRSPRGRFRCRARASPVRTSRRRFFGFQFEFQSQGGTQFRCMVGAPRRGIGGFVRPVETYSLPALPPGRGQQGSAHAGDHGRPARGLPDPWNGSTLTLPVRRTIVPRCAPRMKS